MMLTLHRGSSMWTGLEMLLRLFGSELKLKAEYKCE